MNNKYTAIYTESFRTGSHTSQLVQMRHIERYEAETIDHMLEREEIDSLIFLFDGHINSVY